MKTERCTPQEAAARLLPVDTMGMPLGPGQPVAFLEALGERTDWEHLRVGGALVSPMHANFIVNTGNATASDIDTLIQLVQARVLQERGIALHPEVKSLGFREFP